MKIPLYATEGTQAFLKNYGIKAHLVHKIQCGKTPSVNSLLAKNKIDLIINIPPYMYSRSVQQNRQVHDGYIIRRLAVDLGIPLITNLQLAVAFLRVLDWSQHSTFSTKNWSEYVRPKKLDVKF